MANLDVRRAVKVAKEYIAELFSEEGIAEVGLEEVEMTGDKWNVTIGFVRPFRSRPDDILARYERQYKVVCIDDQFGRPESIKNRDV